MRWGGDRGPQCLLRHASGVPNQIARKKFFYASDGWRSRDRVVVAIGLFFSGFATPGASAAAATQQPGRITQPETATAEGRCRMQRAPQSAAGCDRLDLGCMIR